MGVEYLVYARNVGLHQQGPQVGERKATSAAVMEAKDVAETVSTAVEEAEAECHMVTAGSWLLPNQ
jgi:hypothetical protein